MVAIKRGRGIVSTKHSEWSWISWGNNRQCKRCFDQGVDLLIVWKQRYIPSGKLKKGMRLGCLISGKYYGEGVCKALQMKLNKFGKQ